LKAWLVSVLRSALILHNSPVAIAAALTNNMARTIFLLVVLLNLIALAWVYLKGDELTDTGREPQRAEQVLATDKVRLLPANEKAPEAQSGTQAAPAESCRAFVGATPAEAQSIAKAWMEKLPAVRIAVNPVMPASVFDVAIIGLTNRADAEASLVELKKLGISEGAQIRAEDKDKRFSLVIASFAARGAAEKALNSAIQKGVLSAKLIERQPESEQSVIEVRGTDTTLLKLPELLSSLKMLRPANCAPSL
jgi:hypothetical protein